MARSFPFETPISPEALIDRRDELHQLHLAAADGAHVRLAGPRRYGKTSLLLAHAARLEQASWRTVHVDFYGVTSIMEVCGRIVSAYAGLKEPRVRAQVEALASRLGLSVTTSGIGVTLRSAREAPAREAAATGLGELLNLPQELNERDGRRTLVVFDEFQDLLSAGTSLDGLLRSHVQYHGDAATYIYSGSQPSLMRRLFTDRERPLYGQAEPLTLQPLPIDEVQVELADRFDDLDMDPGDALGPLCTAAAGHPQRTMLLAHLLHRELSMRELDTSTLPESPDVTGVALADALVAKALHQTAEAHQAIWDSLSTGKKALLAALADGIRPTGTQAEQRSGIARATLQSALKDLGREGQHVARIVTGPRGPGGNWRFVDPLFEQWVARRGHLAD